MEEIQKMKKILEEFITLVEEGRYYDAHEVLEDVWYPKRFEDSNEVRFIKGLINAAVSFELYKKGREKNSKKVWLNYLKYRQLLYKINSKHYNEYHKISRKVENHQKKLYNSKKI